MLNYTEFVLLIVLGICVAIVLFLATGIIYTKNGYVSIIEKRRKFYRIEKRSVCYFIPILFRRKYIYPLEEGQCKLKDKIVTYKVNDIMLLYKNKIDINHLIKHSNNLEEDFLKYNIVLISIK